MSELFDKLESWAQAQATDCALDLETLETIVKSYTQPFTFAIKRLDSFEELPDEVALFGEFNNCLFELLNHEKQPITFGMLRQLKKETEG